MFKKGLIVLVLAIALVLRVWHLDTEPVSLFGDELDVGYHAYSILQTGKDYTGHFLPIHFRSLAELRTPLYLYSAVPTVALFGISPLGVRLPAALFGVISVWLFYLLVKLISKNSAISLLAALLIAVSPWHLQYSRAGFEVTEMLAFYLAGIYFFLRGLKQGKFFILSAIFLGFTPWIYNTAKLYLVLTAIGLVFIWREQLREVSRKYLFLAFTVFIIIVAPFAWSTIYGGGAERFGLLSITNDPTIESQIGSARLRDDQVRDSLTLAPTAALTDKFFHNKFVLLGDTFFSNYLQSFSTDFLFVKGSLNLRHSVPGMGEFYIFQFIFLLIGIIFFFTNNTIDKKTKLFVLFWILTAPVPSALTQDGGTHTTRLFLMLPPLILFMAYGIYSAYYLIGLRYRKLYLVALSVIFLLSFVFYLHNYWVHYPWDSERWWHAGYRDAVRSAVIEGEKYDKVIISDANEPSLIFFLGWSQYPPDKFQENYPLLQESLEGFGKVSRLDKFYFPSQGFGVGLYDLGKVLPKNTLYLATMKEINLNLITEPERLPKDVKLLKIITYPSGVPAFYLLTKAN